MREIRTSGSLRGRRDASAPAPILDSTAGSFSCGIPRVSGVQPAHPLGETRHSWKPGPPETCGQRWQAPAVSRFTRHRSTHVIAGLLTKCVKRRSHSREISVTPATGKRKLHDFSAVYERRLSRGVFTGV